MTSANNRPGEIGFTCVVSGSSRGIGLAIATNLLANGWRVVGVDLRKPTTAFVKRYGSRFTVIRGNVAVRETWKRVYRHVNARFGQLTGLVHCAGIMARSDGDIGAATKSAWRETYAVNVEGIAEGCRQLLPLLERCSDSAIVTIGSIVAFVGSSCPQLAYTASKGAVVALTRELAISLASRGIRVNTICPGLICTAMTRQLLQQTRFRKSREGRIPLRRIGTPEEVAGVVRFLLGREASYITGATLTVDGGLSAANASTQSLFTSEIR